MGAFVGLGVGLEVGVPEGVGVGVCVWVKPEVGVAVWVKVKIWITVGLGVGLLGELGVVFVEQLCKKPMRVEKRMIGMKYFFDAI